MRILIVGGGGREHALAWRLAQSPLVAAMYAVPGNPGISELAHCLESPDTIAGYAELAAVYKIDLTVVGPEAPLVAGIVDHFHRRGLNIIGPTQAAARLEGSKLFAKAFFKRAAIPTARSGSNLDSFTYPVVIKADGLAAGKGVVIAKNRAEAQSAIEKLGPEMLIEEFLEGEEISFISLCNGQSITSLSPTQDHKRLRDHDEGPNTGGMGAYVDRRILSPIQIGDIEERIMLPAIRQMARDGTPFTGFLYAGLMLTTEGPKVLEFNVRLGDPETQALLHNLEGDLAEALYQSALGKTPRLVSNPASCSACVVLAAHGYPDQVRTGDVITGIAEAEAASAQVFQAGTRREGNSLVTNGGRVLGVTTKGNTLQSALDNAYQAVAKIHFAGMQFRHDIGQKGLRRW